MAILKVGYHPWLHIALLTLPLCIFTSVLVGLVYWYSWNRKGVPIKSLDAEDFGFASSVINVDFSATRLILVASWSSSVALPLVGSLMSLSSYVMAADIIWLSKRSLHSFLPSPEQLGILTDLLDGKKTAIIAWLMRALRREKSKVATGWIIESPAVVQLSALALR